MQPKYKLVAVIFTAEWISIDVSPVKYSDSALPDPKQCAYLPWIERVPPCFFNKCSDWTGTQLQMSFKRNLIVNVNVLLHHFVKDMTCIFLPVSQTVVWRMQVIFYKNIKTF